MSYRLFYRRHLPHYQPPGATLFVTFRLDGSIPKAVHEQLLAEQVAAKRSLAIIEDPQERSRQAYLEEKRWFGRWDAVLDRGEFGPVWLQRPDVADVVVEALHYRDGKVYTLDAFTIMSTHVHLLCTPLPSKSGFYALQGILQSLKRHTARQANLLLQREGTFWQAESYDHFVRDADEYARIVDYIRQNPVKAGLVAQPEDWPWTFARPLSLAL